MPPASSSTAGPATTGRSWARATAQRNCERVTPARQLPDTLGMSTTDRRDLLRRPVRALGARQLARDGARLLPGRRRLEREADARAAPQRAVALHAVLPRRGLGHRQPVALHRRRAAGGAEVLPRHPAGRRGAPRGLLPSLHARGRRRRRRLDRLDAARHRRRDHLGPPQGLRAPGPDGRRAARRPLQAAARARDDALPRHRRGLARPAGPAHDRALPGGARPAAGLPRGHAQRGARRAAPHRLRREAARRPLPRGPRAHRRRDRRHAARGAAVDGRGRQAAGLGHDAT